MKKSALVVAIVVVGAGLAAWLYFRSAGPEAGGEAATGPVALVETAPLKNEPIARVVEAFGVIAPAATGVRTVAAPFEGTVGKILVAPGVRVPAGAVLLEFAPSAESRLLIDSARSTLALARRSLEAAQERYDLKLSGNTELITAQQAESDARLKVASLEARGLGGDGQLLAPVAGVVSRIDAALGALVAAGAPLVVVTDAAGLEAKLGVEVTVAGLIQSGQSAELTSLQRSGLPAAAGQVSAVGAVLDAMSGEVEVRAGLPAGAVLFAGEHVRALIEIERRTALVVPRRALLPDGGDQVVFTVRAGKAVRHAVTPGIAEADRVEVSGGGLAEGDLVVTQGNHELSDGLAVRTATEAAP